jgi:hypothetical protein
VLTACFACDRPFPAAKELEHLPVGRMVAFDAKRGRLWIVCRWCSHWSLVPMESRWEAVEELERRSASATRLTATDEISLLQLGSVRSVRVGAALPAEEAWWRYGPSLRGRHRRYAAISTVGGKVAAGASIAGMLGLMVVPGALELAAIKRAKVTKVPKAAGDFGAEVAVGFDRWFRYGRFAWSGNAECGHCGAALSHLRFRDRHVARLQGDGTVTVRCTRCRRSDPGHIIHQAEAEDLFRRCLAYSNVAGASPEELRAAVDVMEAGVGASSRYSGPLSFRFVPREELLALELVATEREEAVQLGWEVRDLEARWRSAEVVAAIIDGELT